MATSKRIYVVECSEDCVSLVRATSKAEAMAHVVTVRVASQDDLVALLKDGGQVVDAKAGDAS